MSVPSSRSAVTVFSFLRVDDGVELARLAPFKATREAIAARFGGMLLEGTSEPVDPSEIDALGRFVRVPTGWGDLPAP